MSAPVRPAPIYAPAPDLGVVTTYFNPAGWRSRRALFDRFVEPFARSQLSLVVVECALGDAPFELDGSHDVVRVRAPHALWQKERLINAALPRLPAHVTKVAWLDADVLFSSPTWASDTSRALEDAAIAQPFDRAIYLPRDATAYDGDGDVRESFASVFRRKPELHLHGDYALHGITGLAWAARRDVLEAHGLYDACLSGSGDHLIAHATLGDFRSPCVARTFAGNHRHAAHFAAWVARWKTSVPGRVGRAAGEALHLWHGDRRHRGYPLRNRELAALAFDPDRDLEVSADGAWISRRDDLVRWSEALFANRHEDGDP
jgi:hypothetical protein